VIADTHGLLRPEARNFLQGANHIVHAGDIGNASVLEELRSMAPLVAVRGNNDDGPWAANLPETASITIDGLRCYVIHDRAELAVHGVPDAAQIIVLGHSHKPLLEARDGRLHLNPGSAGRRRFQLPIAIGEILICRASVLARICDLSSGASLDERKCARPGDGSHINW
jgi:uncharacterized protein